MFYILMLAATAAVVFIAPLKPDCIISHESLGCRYAYYDKQKSSRILSDKPGFWERIAWRNVPVVSGMRIGDLQIGYLPAESGPSSDPFINN